MRPKNIIHVLPSRFVGGPERQIIQVAKALRTIYGIESEFHLLGPRGSDSEKLLVENPFAKLLVENGFNVFPFTFVGFLKHISFGRNGNVNEASSVILSYGYKSDIYISAVSMCLGLFLGWFVPLPKRISVVHGFTSSDFKVKVYEWIDRVALTLFSKLILVSRNQLGEIPARLRSKATVVPNAIEFSKNGAVRLTKDQVLKEAGIECADSSKVFLIGCVGRLSFEKGQDILIEAIEKVLVSRDIARNVVRLVFIGDGPTEASVRALVKGNGLDGIVKFLGLKADAYRYMSAFDLLVIPSRREAFPVAFLEGIREGVDVLMTRVGELKFFEGELPKSSSVHFSDPNDVDGLSSAIMKALTKAILNDEDRKKDVAVKTSINKPALEYVQTRYSIEAQAKGYLDVIESAYE